MGGGVTKEHWTITQPVVCRHPIMFFLFIPILIQMEEPRLLPQSQAALFTGELSSLILLAIIWQRIIIPARFIRSNKTELHLTPRPKLAYLPMLPPSARPRMVLYMPFHKTAIYIK